MSGAGGPAECPSPPNNISPGHCFTSTPVIMSPLYAGVTDSGSDTLDYDVHSVVIAEWVPQSLVIGRGVFVVTAVSGSISTEYTGGGLVDGSVVLHTPVTTAYFVPEPATALLLGLGLVALGLRRRGI